MCALLSVALTGCFLELAPAECELEEESPCICPDRSIGVRVCRPEAGLFGACQCGPEVPRDMPPGGVEEMTTLPPDMTADMAPDDMADMPPDMPPVTFEECLATPPPPPWQTWKSLDEVVARLGSLRGVFCASVDSDDIWGRDDDFGFLYQEVTGDFEITAKVATREHVHEWSKTGLMARTALTRGASHVLLHTTGHPYLRLTYRDIPDDVTDAYELGDPSSPSDPFWYRLVRRGPILRAYISDDGDFWRFAGERRPEGMGDTMYVGLIASSHKPDAGTTWGRFEEVTVRERAPGEPPFILGPHPVPRLEDRVDHYAHPTGQGTTCERATPCTLTEALGRARAGDHVFLFGGTYPITETIELGVAGDPDNIITIQGDAHRPTILDGGGRDIGVRLTGSYYRLYNLTLANFATTDTAALKVTGHQNQMEWLTIRDNLTTGLEITEPTLSEAYPYDATLAADFNTVRHSRIERNCPEAATCVLDSAFGARIQSGLGNTFENCLFDGNAGEGWTAWLSVDSTVRDSIAARQQRTGYSLGGRLMDRYATGTRIERSVAYRNLQAGVLVNDARSTTMTRVTSCDNDTQNIQSGDSDQTEVEQGLCLQYFESMTPGELRYLHPVRDRGAYAP